MRRFSSCPASLIINIESVHWWSQPAVLIWAESSTCTFELECFVCFYVGIMQHAERYYPKWHKHCQCTRTSWSWVNLHWISCACDRRWVGNCFSKRHPRAELKSPVKLWLEEGLDYLFRSNWLGGHMHCELIRIPRLYPRPENGWEQGVQIIK